MTPELYHILLKNVILFSRPVGIGVQSKVPRPGKTDDAPLNSGCICSIKMPNFLLIRFRRRYFEINFAINYLMMAERI